jgi:hypothetical protein
MLRTDRECRESGFSGHGPSGAENRAGFQYDLGESEIVASYAVSLLPGEIGTGINDDAEP